MSAAWSDFAGPRVLDDLVGLARSPDIPPLPSLLAWVKRNDCGGATDRARRKSLTFTCRRTAANAPHRCRHIKSAGSAGPARIIQNQYRHPRVHRRQ
jgi:hypothetical protein